MPSRTSNFAQIHSAARHDFTKPGINITKLSSIADRYARKLSKAGAPSLPAVEGIVQQLRTMNRIQQGPITYSGQFKFTPPHIRMIQKGLGEYLRNIGRFDQPGSGLITREMLQFPIEKDYGSCAFIYHDKLPKIEQEIMLKSPHCLAGIAAFAPFSELAFQSNPPPGVLPITQTLIHRERIALVGPWMSGGSLFRNSYDGITISAKHYLQIASTVAGLHQRGIVHGDMHPHNWLFKDEDFQDLTLIDFGFAQSANDPTAMEAGYGALKYRPPELRFTASWQPTFATDAWAVIQIFKALRMFKPDPDTTFDYNALYTLVKKGESSDPSLRFQNGMEVYSALLAVQKKIA